MKALTLLSLLIAAPAVAAPSHTVIQTKGMVDLHRLVCVKPIGGQGEMYTQISADQPVVRIPSQNSPIELRHLMATGDGCDEAKLLQIQKKAMMGFGFLQGVPVTVTKDVSASEGDHLNGCVADYVETVKIELGLGITVSSTLVDTRAAGDCK